MLSAKNQWELTQQRLKDQQMGHLADNQPPSDALYGDMSVANQNPVSSIAPSTTGEAIVPPPLPPVITPPAPGTNALQRMFGGLTGGLNWFSKIFNLGKAGRAIQAAKQAGADGPPPPPVRMNEGGKVSKKDIMKQILYSLGSGMTAPLMGGINPQMLHTIGEQAIQGFPRISNGLNQSSPDSNNISVSDSGIGAGAHGNIDTLMNHNQKEAAALELHKLQLKKNQDHFELMDKTIKTIGNFIPPVGAINTIKSADRILNAPHHESQAFFKGLKESVLGEPDPVGPQGIPFSEFMARKKGLDPKVKSIIGQHVNELFDKENEPRQEKSLNPLKMLFTKNPNARV